MPTYDYRCESCDHRFEAVQRMTDPPLSSCPKCGESVKRLIGAGAGIIFKGSGFYCTDYRSDSYRQAAAKDKTPAKASAGNKKSDEKKPKKASS